MCRASVLHTGAAIRRVAAVSVVCGLAFLALGLLVALFAVAAISFTWNEQLAS